MIKTIIFDIDNTMYSFKTGNQAGMAALCAYAKEQFGITEGEFLDKFKKGKKLAEDRVGTDTAAIHNRLIRMQVILELMGKPLFPHTLNLYHCYWDALLASAKPEPGLLEAMEALKKERPELQFVEDSGRGYRRVVPSPRPVTIVERDSILNLLDNEYIVIACGGGGIPVIKNENGDYTGVPAVIDKDFASAKLAELVDADYLFILTAVDHVAVNFGRPDQMQLTEMTVDQAREYCSQGQFAAGSMLPKVQAAMAFAESKKGRNAVIASLEKAPLAMVGKSGTRIYQG